MFVYLVLVLGKWESSLHLCVCQRGNGGTLSSWVFRDFRRDTVRQQLLAVLSTQHYMMFLLFCFSFQDTTHRGTCSLNVAFQAV